MPESVFSIKEKTLKGISVFHSVAVRPDFVRVGSKNFVFILLWGFCFPVCPFAYHYTIMSRLSTLNNQCENGPGMLFICLSNDQIVYCKMLFPAAN